MRNLSACPTVFGQDILTASAISLSSLGQYAETGDGRGFRYVQVGAVDTVAGSLYQSSAPIANHLANTPPVVAIGATSFVYTPGATIGAANLYAGGYLQVDTTPGNGYLYQVSGHGAIASATAFTLNLADPIQVALTASSRVGLRAHPYKNVIVCPTTLTAKVVGVAPCIIPVGQFGWIQTRGLASCLINGTPGVGIAVTNSATTSGAVDVITTTNLVTSQVIVGHMQQVGVSTKNNFVDLCLE